MQRAGSNGAKRVLHHGLKHGNAEVREACGRYGGFYLGSIGGPAARLAEHSIRKVEVLEYEELGMEAIWRIEVEDFPAFIVIDGEGNDFYADLTGPRPQPLLEIE